MKALSTVTRLVSGKVKLNLLVVLGLLLILGALAKLIHIVYSNPGSREIEESVLITKELKLYICGASFSDPRIYVDPCGAKDVRFRAVSGLTTINVYGIQQPDDVRGVVQHAKKVFEKTDLDAVTLVFNEGLETKNSGIVATIKLDKEISNAQR